MGKVGGIHDSTKLFIVCITLFLTSCAEYKIDSKDNKATKKYFTSHGFALVYEDSLYEDKTINKKINNDEIIAVHSYLKRNTPIKIINPDNLKVIETKIYKQGDYPNFFNIVISKKIANFLELDINNPYIELYEVKKNKTFIAKEGNIFEEEKNVVLKIPTNEVKIADLSENKVKIKKKNIQKKNFIIVIGDFYYLDSANNLKLELQKETKINNLLVKKIKDNQFRLLVGPFKNFNTLKSAYISLNNLGFEGLNIYQE